MLKLQVRHYMGIIGGIRISRRNKTSVPSLMQKALKLCIFLRKTRFRNIGRSRESLTRFASARRRNLETPAFSNGDGRKLLVGIYYTFLTQFSIKNCPDSHDNCDNCTCEFNEWEIWSIFLYIKKKKIYMKILCNIINSNN